LSCQNRNKRSSRLYGRSLIELMASDSMPQSPENNCRAQDASPYKMEMIQALLGLA
jgi:hypothetical protein